MAPEQYQRKAEPASDQYSLAVIVYEWLCGDRPFGSDELQMMYQHLEKSPPSLREKNAVISPEVEQVVLRALEKDPQKRFASVQEFAKAFEQASQLRSVIGTPLLTYHGHIGGANAVHGLLTGGGLPLRAVMERCRCGMLTRGVTFLSYDGHSQRVNAVAWSPDGTRIASVGYGVHIWQAV